MDGEGTQQSPPAAPATRASGALAQRCNQDPHDSAEVGLRRCGTALRVLAVQVARGPACRQHLSSSLLVAVSYVPLPFSIPSTRRMASLTT